MARTLLSAVVWRTHRNCSVSTNQEVKTQGLSTPRSFRAGRTSTVEMTREPELGNGTRGLRPSQLTEIHGIKAADKSVRATPKQILPDSLPSRTG
jgi:hypothetical protein